MWIANLLKGILQRSGLEADGSIEFMDRNGLKMSLHVLF